MRIESSRYTLADLTVQELDDLYSVIRFYVSRVAQDKDLTQDVSVFLDRLTKIADRIQDAR